MQLGKRDGMPIAIDGVAVCGHIRAVLRGSFGGRRRFLDGWGQTVLLHYVLAGGAPQKILGHGDGAPGF